MQNVLNLKFKGQRCTYETKQNSKLKKLKIPVGVRPHLCTFLETTTYITCVPLNLGVVDVEIVRWVKMMKADFLCSPTLVPKDDGE